MKKITSSLFIVLASISTVFATAMNDVRTYTEHLEKAIVLHDLTNANLYAQALSELVMTGNVSKAPSSQPAYKEGKLSPIKAVNYGIGAKATEQERKEIYKALDALASVPTLQQWWSKTGLPGDKNFDVVNFMEREKDEASHSAHRLAVNNYFKEQFLKNLQPPEGNHTKEIAEVFTDLDRLFWTAGPVTDPRLDPSGSYPSFEYKNSPYTGTVDLTYPMYLGLNSAPLQQLYPWIKTAYISESYMIPEGVRGLDFTGINVIKVKEGKDEGKDEDKERKDPHVSKKDPPSDEDIYSSDDEDEGKAPAAVAAGVLEKDPLTPSQREEILRDFLHFKKWYLTIGTQAFSAETPVQFLNALEKEGKISFTYPEGIEEKFTSLLKSAIRALTPQEKNIFSKNFKIKPDFGGFSPQQRTQVLEMLRQYPNYDENINRIDDFNIFLEMLLINGKFLSPVFPTKTEESVFDKFKDKPYQFLCSLNDRLLLFSYEKDNFSGLKYPDQVQKGLSVKMYGRLIAKAISALTLQEKEDFQKLFEATHNFGQFSPRQRNIISQMLKKYPDPFFTVDNIEWEPDGFARE